MGLGARRVTLVAAVAVTCASLGVLAWQRLTGSTIADNTANLGGLTVEVAAAEWVEMGHVQNGQGGFLMPHQMMPDAPRGDEVRLGISITLSNTDSRTQGFNLVDEFVLVGGTGAAPRRLRADSIGTLPRLAPGAAVHGTLYFDLTVPSSTDPPIYLRWVRDGHTVSIPVLIGAGAPTHDHG